LHSDLDTFHRCRIHGAGVPHPEDEDASFDRTAHKVAMYRKIFEGFRQTAMDCGVRSKKGFRTLCERQLKDSTEATPADWVDAAEKVAENFAAEHAEKAAQAAGYSCDLEARWAADAADDRLEGSGGW
jgi:hypothetical protein